MTPKKIYQLRPDIKEKVEQKFPVSKAERKCKREKADMDNLRWRMAKRLYEEAGIDKMEFK